MVQAERLHASSETQVLIQVHRGNFFFNSTKVKHCFFQATLCDANIFSLLEILLVRNNLRTNSMTDGKEFLKRILMVCRNPLLTFLSIFPFLWSLVVQMIHAAHRYQLKPHGTLNCCRIFSHFMIAATVLVYSA